MSFNWLDIVLAAIILVAVIIGVVKGFVRELVGLLIIVLSFVLAGRFYGPVASAIGGIISSPTAAKFTAFILVFLAALVAGSIVAALITKLTKEGLGFVNHLLGGLVGFLEGVLIAGAVVFGFLAFPVDNGAVAESKLAPMVYRVTKTIIQFVPKEFKDQIKTAYDSLSKDEKPAKEKTANGQEI